MQFPFSKNIENDNVRAFFVFHGERHDISCDLKEELSGMKIHWNAKNTKIQTFTQKQACRIV